MVSKYCLWSPIKCSLSSSESRRLKHLPPILPVPTTGKPPVPRCPVLPSGFAFPFVPFAPSWCILGFPSAPEPVHSRARLAKNQNKILRVLHDEKSPQIPAHTHHGIQIFTKYFSKIFANCTLNNAICASTIQGKWKGNVARRQWYRPPLLASRHLPRSTAARAG